MSGASGHPLRLVRDEAPRAPTVPVEPAGDSGIALSAALESVVRRFGGFMRRTAHRHGLGEADIEEVVQDTRIRLWKALGSAARIEGAPTSYVCRTVTSAALDFIRRRRARREDPLEDERHALADAPEAAEPADGLVGEDEARRAVVRALELLVESRRAVVRMYLAGYEREEIAELLGWSEAKTRNLLYRGLADMRVTLQSWGYGPGESR